MKTIYLLFIISLLINGVVSDEKESVSVYEGDSVTLHTDTKIQKADTIDWRFGDEEYLIARIMATSLKIYDEDLDVIFRGGLQVNNQTGDLIITNITTQHTGLYQLEINSRISTTKTFNISVFGDKVKTEMKGDSVILVNNVIKKPGDEKMVWRIQHNNSPVAEIIRNVKELTYNVPDERFKDRLQVDVQTGDLIITNIRSDDCGSYKVDITVGSHTYTIHRSFSVNVKGNQSSGPAAGISVISLLVTAAAAAVAAVIYYHQTKLFEKLTVYEGETVHLKTKVTDIQRDDVIEWTYRSKDCVIARINPANNITSTSDDEFKDRLHLDPKTGNLTIDDITWGHRGYYTLKIIRDGKTSDRGFLLAVKLITLDVHEGKSVHLKNDLNDIKGDDVIEWRFGDKETLIAEINPALNIFSTYDGDDKLFKDKLKLNDQTGDLTINNIRWKHDGFYKLKFIRDGKPSYRRIYVSLYASMLVVDEGGSIFLRNTVTDIQTDDVVEWTFGETLIAKINPANNIFRTYDGNDDLFKDKLILDHQTGDLTIKDFREEHEGEYLLKIIRGQETSYKTFILSFGYELEEEVYEKEGESVDLKTYLDDIKRDDVIEWYFGDTLVAEISPGENKFRTSDDVPFKYKLELNPQTGDLNIKDFREKHKGDYVLKIVRNGKASYRRFKTSIGGDSLRKKGDPVMRRRGGSEWNGGGDSVKKRERDSVAIEIQPLMPYSSHSSKTTE